MKTSNYNTPKANWLTKLLWKAAGADKYILEKSTYTDHVKYACLGGIVVATGFMAAMAGGYAFYIVFEPRTEAISSVTNMAQNVITATQDSLSNVVAQQPLVDTSSEDNIHTPTSIMSIIFGIIWGLIIFNIDRFIVASTGKGDGTEAITWDEIKGAVPRILMGMIIAITISKPVEIRMFKTEIDVELHKEQAREYTENIKLAEINNRPLIDEIKGKIAECKGEISEKKEELTIKERDYTQEMDGYGGTGRKGIGPIAQKKKEIRDRVLLEFQELKKEKEAEIFVLAEELKVAELKLAREKSKAQVVANSLNGLLRRLQIAHDLAGWKITLFITLLFMAIELTPIFFKMMLIKSPYDFMSDNIKSLMKAEQGIEIKYDFYEDKSGVQKDLVVNHQADLLLKEKIKLLQAQNEMNELVVENWKNEEIKNIKKDPGAFVDKKV